MTRALTISSCRFVSMCLSLVFLCSCEDEVVVVAPELTTTSVTAVTITTAISGGNVLSDGGAAVTARGICWSVNPNPTIIDNKTSDGAGTGIFTSNLTGLTAGTLYHIRSYATSSFGTAYGNDVEFTTVPLVAPQLTTTLVTAIAHTAAASGGTIISDGGAPVTQRGVCWSVNSSPTIANNKTSDGTGTGAFASNLSGLTAGTTYHLRSYATNSVGTAYGNEIEFKTIPTTITDIDGNIYHTVIIGTQVWLVENLKTTKYRNGDAVPSISDNSGWAALTTGAYSIHSNTASNATTYGNLYNWFTIADVRNIAPNGWHVPNETEWTTLQTFLGGELNGGGKLKEAGLTHWQSPNEGATNETGFTGLPGGYRDSGGIFSNLGFKGTWWSATEKTVTNAYALFTYSEGAQFHGEAGDKNLGLSIRCIMD